MYLHFTRKGESRLEFEPTRWMLSDESAESVKQSSIESLHLDVGMQVICFCIHI